MSESKNIKILPRFLKDRNNDTIYEINEKLKIKWNKKTGYCCINCTFTNTKQCLIIEHIKTKHINNETKKDELSEKINRASLGREAACIKADIKDDTEEIPWYKKFRINGSTYKTKKGNIIIWTDGKFGCINCDYASKREQDLEDHIRTHTGEKPYECEFKGCTEKFAYLHSLKDHIRKHTGERFECPVDDCDYKTIHKYSVKQHMKSHAKKGDARKKKRELEFEMALIGRGYKKFEGDPNILPPLGYYIREKSVDFKCIGTKECSRAFIDFIMGVKNGFLCVEIDEHQHKHIAISCETRRMASIHESSMLDPSTPLANMPLVFIRYNPDKFSINGETVDISSEERHEKIISYIKNMKLDPEQRGELQILYAYYDSVSNLDKPLICYEEEFPEHLLPACKLIC